MPMSNKLVDRKVKLDECKLENIQLLLCFSFDLFYNVVALNVSLIPKGVRASKFKLYSEIECQIQTSLKFFR